MRNLRLKLLLAITIIGLCSSVAGLAVLAITSGPPSKETLNDVGLKAKKEGLGCLMAVSFFGMVLTMMSINHKNKKVTPAQPKPNEGVDQLDFIPI